MFLAYESYYKELELIFRELWLKLMERINLRWQTWAELDL